MEDEPPPKFLTIAKKRIELHHAKRNHAGYKSLHEDQRTKGTLNDIPLRCGRTFHIADTVGAKQRSVEVAKAPATLQRTW